MAWALAPAAGPFGLAAGAAPVGGPPVPRTIAHGDVDGDGRADVVRLGRDGRAELWFGQADRGGVRLDLQPDAAFDAVAMVDADGDERDELLFWSSTAARRAQRWVRTAERRWRTEELAAPPAGTRAVVLDIDGDGRQDVLWHAAGGPDGDALDRARTGGGFQRSGFWPEAGLEPHVGDFDGDGNDDVVWYDRATGRGVLWWGGATVAAAPFDIGTGATLLVGDFDGHWGDDLLVGGPNGNVELDGLPDRRFEPSIVAASVDAGTMVGDVNGDRRPDLIETAGQTGVWNNDSSGWLWQPWDAPPAADGAVLVAADIDGDRFDDVFLAPGSAPASDGVPWAVVWQWGSALEQIFREPNPYAADGLIVRMLGIVAGRRVDVPLASVHDACGANWPVSAHVADLLQDMLSTAAAGGLGICINSGYRSYDEQVQIRTDRCARTGFAGDRACIYEWLSGTYPFTGANQIARPGHSRHQLGIAVDLGDLAGNVTPQVTSWLSANAHRWGFYNLGDRKRLGPGFAWGSGGEPWHVSIDGR